MITDRIVCGFYTPDYADWAEALRASLDAIGEPHDIVQVAKASRDWAGNTMAKPLHILNAMGRHPDKTIIFVDADCTVHGDLHPLTQLGCDVAFNMAAQKQRGRGIWLRVRAGTIVINPTRNAERFVKAWIDQCRLANLGEDDETALARTVLATAGISIQQLDDKWRSMDFEHQPDAVIIHASASVGAKKMRSAQLWLCRQLRIRAA